MQYLYSALYLKQLKALWKEMLLSILLMSISHLSPQMLLIIYIIATHHIYYCYSSCILLLLIMYIIATHHIYYCYSSYNYYNNIIPNIINNTVLLQCKELIRIYLVYMKLFRIYEGETS